MPDFISASSKLSSVEVFLGSYDPGDETLKYGPGKLVEAPADLADFLGRDIAAGDIDGDSQDEFAVSSFSGGPGKKTLSAKVFVFDDDLNLLQTIDASELGLSNGDSFGASLEFGNVVDGDLYQALIVGAPDVKIGKMQNAGEVFVFRGTGNFPPMGLPFDDTNPITLRKGTNANDMLGFQLATVEALVGVSNDVVVSTQWQNNQTRAEHFLSPIGAFPASPNFTLVPGAEAGGWATTGIHISDIDNMSPGSSDYLIGVPNAACGTANSSMGLVYLYLNPALSEFLPSPVPPSRTFLPEEFDPDWNGFGWSATAISATVTTVTDEGTSVSTRHSFVLIGEPGRNEVVDGVELAFSGRVYIYRYDPPPRPEESPMLGCPGPNRVQP